MALQFEHHHHIFNDFEAGSGQGWILKLLGCFYKNMLDTGLLHLDSPGSISLRTLQHLLHSIPKLHMNIATLLLEKSDERNKAETRRDRDYVQRNYCLNAAKPRRSRRGILCLRRPGSLNHVDYGCSLDVRPNEPKSLLPGPILGLRRPVGSASA